VPLDAISARDVLLPEVRARLAPADVIDVAVKEDLDHDGDPILRVLVTFRSEGSVLNAESVLSLMIAAQDRLAESGERRFPHLNFRTEEEAALDAG
jgi:hypothetical protein